MSDHSFGHKVEAVLTNVAYMVAGMGVILYSMELLAVGVALITLGVLSGVHHYFLTRFTRKLDYLGMYMVIFAITALFSGIPVVPSIFITAVLATVVAFAVGSEPAIVGIGVVMGLIFVGVTAGIGPALEVTAFISIAYVFNHLGDGPLKDDHSIIHGLGWHNVTAYALYLASTYMVV